MYLKSIKYYDFLFDASLDNVKYFLDYIIADCGENLDLRKSTTEYVFILGGGSISWKSTLLKCVAQSTTEIKYVAAAKVAKETISLDTLIIKMGLKQ